MKVSMDRRLIQVSRYIAKYLRHAPQELGLTLQTGGWVMVGDFLAGTLGDTPQDDEHRPRTSRS
jgi:RNA:NAD 2'-phosphotransferase (TPT1/KptA family)